MPTLPNTWLQLNDPQFYNLGAVQNPYANMPPVDLLPIQMAAPAPAAPLPAQSASPPPVATLPLAAPKPAAMPSQSAKPLRPKSSEPKEPSATPDVKALMAELDQAGLKSIKDQGVNIQELKDKLKSLDAADLPIDLRPVAALVDSWTGSNLAAFAAPAETAKDRAAMKEKLQSQILQAQQGLSENEVAQLRSQLNNQLQLEQLAYRKERDAVQDALERQKIGIMAMSAANKQGPGGPTTDAQKTVDREFAKDYADFVAGGGFAAAQKGIQQMEAAKKTLADKPDLTGWLVGMTPDKLRNLTAPESASLINNVNEIVSANLKNIMGAQFTQKEGERVMANAFNPSLSGPENLKRLERLQEQMVKAYEAKIEAAQYYEKNGTLKGFKGKTEFKADDFMVDGAKGQESELDRLKKERAEIMKQMGAK